MGNAQNKGKKASKTSKTVQTKTIMTVHTVENGASVISKAGQPGNGETRKEYDWTAFIPGSYLNYKSKWQQFIGLLRKKSQQDRLSYFGMQIIPCENEESNDQQEQKVQQEEHAQKVEIYRFFQPYKV